LVPFQYNEKLVLIENLLDVRIVDELHIPTIKTIPKLLFADAVATLIVNPE